MLYYVSSLIWGGKALSENVSVDVDRAHVKVHLNYGKRALDIPCCLKIRYANYNLTVEAGFDALPCLPLFNIYKTCSAQS